MKQIIQNCEGYNIYKADETCLRIISAFVVRSNYMHHLNADAPGAIDETESIYQEELAYFENSQFFVAEDYNCNIIGCIRVMRWDKKKILPIEKVFGINPLEFVPDSTDCNIWHIGRFATASGKGHLNISLFKRLMIYAISPICENVNSYMFAECDSKLLRVMDILGINTVNLRAGINYLGSETIPVIAQSHGLISFYKLFKHLTIRNNNRTNEDEVA